MIRTARTEELDEAGLRVIRELMDLAFGDEFTEDDWDHSLGGLHLMAEEEGRLVAHAAVVPRTLRVGERRLHTGYVEGMATHPAHRRRGHASRVVERMNEHVRAGYELGALSDATDFGGFYQRFGWRLWSGETYVDGPNGTEPTPEDDGNILILPTPTTGELDLAAAIACDWRSGDVW